MFTLNHLRVWMVKYVLDRLTNSLNGKKKCLEPVQYFWTFHFLAKNTKIQRQKWQFCAFNMGDWNSCLLHLLRDEFANF